ncbi:MAG: T9SS type A sorting domain-containing protein [Chlorobi bacterium]|nr:T9SS type A sorting domain-containing protein [Chlorobiota bacterium]
MGRYRYVLILCIASITISGCIAVLDQVVVPRKVTMGEPFVVLMEGSISGDESGMAGVILQVPESWVFESATVSSDIGLRPLHINDQIGSFYKPEAGYVILALVDSLHYGNRKSGRASAMIRFTPGSVGRFSLKYMAGATTGSGKHMFWRLTDPQGKTFQTLEDSSYIFSVTVKEPELNGTPALAFDGSRSYLRVSAGDSSLCDPGQDFTLEMWFITTEPNGVLVGTRSSDLLTPYFFELRINEYGRLILQSSDGLHAPFITSSRFVSDGSWHHVAILFSSTRKRFILMLDGQVRDSLVLPVGEIPGTEPILIGARGGRTLFFNGKMEEFRIWDGERALDDLRAMSDHSLGGYEEGLRVLYNFDETDSTHIFNMAAGRGFNAVPFNRPKLVPSSAPVRVEMMLFSAVVDNDSIRIEWQTFDERNVKRYDLEKRYENGKYFTIESFDPQRFRTNRNVYTVNAVFQPGKVVYFRVRQVNLDGTVNLSDEIVIGAEEARDFILDQNDPNPFMDSTDISYTLKETAFVTLKVYDVMAREVMTLVSEKQKPGTYSVRVYGTDLEPGIYFYRLKTRKGVETRKMIRS